MPFGGLLRRSSTRAPVDSAAPTTSTSYQGSSVDASSSKPRASPSARERLTRNRTSKTRTSIDTDRDLLYPTHQLQPPHSANRGSHYSTTDDHGIGEAPSHAPSSTRPSAAPSPSLSTHTPSQSVPVAASSLATSTSQVNQYDRLFGLAGSSASVSPRRSPAALPQLVAFSSTRSIPTSSSVQHTESLSTSQATVEPPSATASTSATLLRRKSTKSRSPFPPAASSTGTSSSQRDRTTMGSAVFRRPSLRRRTGSADSTASRTEKVPDLPAPAPPVDLTTSSSPLPSGMAASATVPALPASNPSSAPLLPASTSSGRFARLFGRRKSISSPTNFTHLSKPDLVADPVPALQDASFSLNKQSPPLAVIAAGWQDPAKTTHAFIDANRPVSPRTVSHADVAPPAIVAADEPVPASAQPSVSEGPFMSETVDSEASKASAFTFPARASLSNDSASKDLSARDPLRSRQAKHSTSRSLPLAAMPISNPIPASSSADLTDLSSIPIPQRRPSKIGRSLSHRKNSRSLSMIGSMFDSIGSKSQSASSSPPLPQAAATLSQRYPPAENCTSQTSESPATSHSRRPSLRSRLKLGRNMSEQGPQRPTTPEIESWKQKYKEAVADVSSGTDRKARGSIDSPFRPKPAEMPVKITRSKSMIRRKPPPEIKQEEIDSSSSTPVYSRTFRALEVDQHSSSPLGGSPVSSPEAEFSTLPGVDSRFISQVAAPAATSSPPASSKANGLGLIGASLSSAEALNNSVPSIDIRPSTPSRDASPVVATNGSESANEKLAPSASPALGGKRLSSGTYSVADTSMSVDRPWSLISAGEADTPLLKLRKLVVNTNGSDDSRDEEDADDGLFFRPLNGTSQSKEVSTAPQPEEILPSTEKMMDAIKKAEIMSEDESEQLRSSSQTTTRSDTKHEVASVHSSGSSTLRITRNLAAQPSISGLSATSGALSDASQASTIRVRNVPASLTQALAETTVAPTDADSIGPLPTRSPAASQNSFRNRQHRRDSSTGSAYSQATVQQGRRASTASRITMRSSGHWSESRLSEDALSALEAEVGQARRAEVIALGKGRVKDWVADRPLPTTEAPTLSRSNTLRKKAQQAGETEVVSEVKVDEKEAQRQKALNEHVSRKLQQLSGAQFKHPSTAEIRDIPDEESQASSPFKKQAAPVVEPATSEPRSAALHFARLSAFHDRKLMVDTERAATKSAAPVVAPSNQMVEEAIRLGRAPSKRVRRNVSEAKSVGEAVMVEREAAGATPRRASAASGATSLAAARHRRKSASSSSKQAPSSAEQMNPRLIPAMPAAPLLNLRDVIDTAASKTKSESEVVAPQTNEESDSKQHSKQRSFATSDEAARAKQQELVEREKRHADKEAKRQAQLQQKYAKKKQSDPLLAARLALAGLEPPVEAMPKLRAEQWAGAPTFKTSIFGTGLQVPEVPERRASSAGSNGKLSAVASPMVRKNSNAGSVMSFHTALDVPVEAAIDESKSASPKMAPADVGGDAPFASKASGEVRPDTSYSIASSLAVDFEFPVPPQRMKEQLSEDGTLLSRAGLQESPVQQQWRERRHCLAATKASPQQGRIRTPPRDSSLRHRADSSANSGYVPVSSLFPTSNDNETQGMIESRTMPQLAAVSPLDSVKQSATLRRSRSVGFNSRDLRRMTREQMMKAADKHPSPKSSYATLPGGKGLGIEMRDETGGRGGGSRRSGAGANSGTATPSTVVGMHRQTIIA